jgi:hypothetical protein
MLNLVKHIYNMGFVGAKSTKGFIFPIFRKYPKYIKGSWIQWTLMQDVHGNRGIECLYLNNKNPSGTLIFSNFINNEYPTSWIDILNIQDDKARNCKDAVVNRVYCQPYYRRKKINISLAILGYTVWWAKYNVRVRQGLSASKAASNMQKQSAKLILALKFKRSKNKKNENVVLGESKEIILEQDLEHFKDPILPATWHSLRPYEKTPNEILEK